MLTLLAPISAAQMEGAAELKCTVEGNQRFIPGAEETHLRRDPMGSDEI